MKLYPWQEKAVDTYLKRALDKDTGMYVGGTGVIKAVTGAGKSLAAKTIIETICKGGGRVTIASHSKTILDQWKLILSDYETTEIEVDYTTFHKLCKKGNDKPIHFLLIEECHRSTSPEFKKMYDLVDADNILGISATPDKESIEKCGDIIIDVGFDEAKTCPFYVHFYGIELIGAEYSDYRRLSNLINKFYNDEVETPDVNLEDIIFKRRSIVYNAHSRFHTAMQLIRREYRSGRKIAVFCQRKAQANLISNKLSEEKINHALYHSDTVGTRNEKQLDSYRSGKVKILVSVGMVREGFDDPDTDCGIIVSTPLTETFHVQTIGRIIRFKPGKRAVIHFILANTTTDLKVLKHAGNYDFELHNIRLPIKSEHKHEYFQGTKYSFRDQLLWMKMKKGRQYFKYHPILEELRKKKPLGGSFVVTDKGIYMMIDRDIIKITDDVPEFEIDPKRVPIDYTKPLSEDEKEEMHQFLETFS